jgi:tetratricopeptide (TPR) repeat protein
MTISEARKILGLGSDEDPRPSLDEFRNTRDRIAEMVRSAPNEALGLRYQDELVEFDQAIAAVREHLEALGLQSRMDEQVAIQELPEILLPPEKSTRFQSDLRFVGWVVILTAVALGGLYYYHRVESARIQHQERIAALGQTGSELLENRRWEEASVVFAQIESLSPGTELAKLGRRSIEAGMTDEQTQFIGYWNGQAIAEFEAGRLDEADAIVHKLLERYPQEKEAADLLAKVAKARSHQSREAEIAAARRSLDAHQWNQAIDAAKRILSKYPGDSAAKIILADASASFAKQKADELRAGELLVKATALDTGDFNQQALDLLREAAMLAPGNTEIASRLEKMAAYTRTLRVPGDFPTPAEAIAASRDRDRIILSEDVWKGPLVINSAIELLGAGSGKTMVECHPDSGSAITVGPEARGARISGITIRHQSFQAIGTDRFSAALVRGGGAIFVDCHFNDASGHGLAVIEAGEAIAMRSRFQSNGWNGAAAIGKNSLIEVRDSEAIENFENGIETWEGAAAVLINNRCEGNSRNGIHIDNQLAAATLEGNQLIGNREFGLVLHSAARGKVNGNMARANLLGGFVVSTRASALQFTGNHATLNEGPGLVLEKGLAADAYASNTAAKNAIRDLFPDATLAAPEEHAHEPDENKQR